MSSEKRSKGSQKIEIKKIMNKRNLQVTFCKRRGGLFKKANELSTLCGVDIAIIIFSPRNKTYSFGHPNVEGLINRYLTRGLLPHAHANAPTTMQHTVEETPIEQLNRLTHELEVEKKYAEELNKVQNASQAQPWWTGPIEKMNIQQLSQFKSALEDMKKNVAHKCTKILIQNAMKKPNLSSNPALPSHMLQTPMFQNFKLLQSDIGGGLY